MRDTAFQNDIWSLEPDGLNSAECCVQGQAQFLAHRCTMIEFPVERLLKRKPIDDVSECSVAGQLSSAVALRYANKKSAKDLARERIVSLGVFGDYIVPDTGRYLAEHRDTRNYFTHLDSEGKHRILEGRELLTNAKATLLLLYGSLCALMGMDMQTLVEIVKTSRFKCWDCYYSRELYAKTES